MPIGQCVAIDSNIFRTDKCGLTREGRKTIRIQYYNLKANYPCKIALVADLHDHPYLQIIGSFKAEHPDFIAINGDLLYAAIPGHSIYEHVPESRQHFKYTKYAQYFLKEAVQIAPVLFSTGNHELYLNERDREFLSNLGVIFLDDSFSTFDGLVFGGLSSSYKYLANTGTSSTKDEHQSRWNTVFTKVNTDWLDVFEQEPGYKILLCHHPEFYDRYLRDRNIDLILAGHAHGGQIRIFKRGLYAYGQGWFPKYTSGLSDGKLIVSRGLANTSRIPRIFNPTELVYIKLKEAL